MLFQFDSELNVSTGSAFQSFVSEKIKIETFCFRKFFIVHTFKISMEVNKPTTKYMQKTDAFRWSSAIHMQIGMACNMQIPMF